MADTVIKVAFDESIRALNSQTGTLDGLRTRAGTLLAAASLVTSFLGGQALAKPALQQGQLVRPEIGTWGWLAIAAFVGVAVLALAILAPYEWRFTVNAKELVWIYDRRPDWTVEKFYRELALRNEVYWQKNARRLLWLFRFYRYTIVLLVLETVAWTFDLT